MKKSNTNQRGPLEERFFKKIKKTKTCWLWTAATYPFGYGQIQKGKRGEGILRAHRVSWEIHKGKIPKGFLVCHHCDNPKCVNPNHLFIGTKRDNNRDMIRKGRYRALGEKYPHGKLSWSDIKEIKTLAKKGIKKIFIARLKNINKGTVYAILNNKIWETN